MNDSLIGQEMYDLAERLFPLPRSLTGNGVRESFKLLNTVYPFTIHEVPSGTQAFDWTVPFEWNVREAYVEASNGKRVIDFAENNLHLMGYSVPMDETISREVLFDHLYTEADNPDLIPYVTSYYKEDWGFCVSEHTKQKLTNDLYHVKIDSTLAPGSLTYGEIVIPGETPEEVLISTYLCHPSMANNELSGPCVAVFLARELAKEKRKLTYRIFVGPETIGSILYISQHLEHLKKHVVAGFVLSCVGDDRDYSIIQSRWGNSLADRALMNTLQHHFPKYQVYSYRERGSDERQYCAPGVALPVCGFCRTKYWHYPEYHTSADDMSVISPKGLQGAFDVMKKCCMALEENKYYQTQVLCEPQLGKRGLYPATSIKHSADHMGAILDMLAYSDGTIDLLEISDKTGHSMEALAHAAKTLVQNELLRCVK